MEIFIFKTLFHKRNISSAVITFVVILLFISLPSYAQMRNYSLVYSDNIKGSTEMLGNTLMNIVDNDTVNHNKMDGNRLNGNSTYGNDNENMQYADVDGNTGYGSVTRNSSTSDLNLPAGINTIKLARLYWGGRVKTSDFDLTIDSNKTIKIRKGTTSPYSVISALGIDKILLSTGVTEYQAYTDITAFVKNNGAGTYEVGNAPLSVGHIASGGNHGGWCIVVVYENSNVNYNSVRIYDGFEQVYNGGNPLSNKVTLTGLNVPSGSMEAGDAKMGVLAWEGDANLTQDYLKINSNLFSNATNQSNNPWNGTITNNGIHVTTKNPDYTNQMGIDIDQFDVGTGYGISPNDSTVSLEFGTESDQYFTGLFTFSIKMKDPTITLDNIVSDANNNHLGEANEVLTYILKGGNTGPGNANSIVLADTLPPTVTYLPGSLKIMSCAGFAPGTQTDAAGDDASEYIVNGSVKTIMFRIGAGATSSVGGTLASNETYEVQFKVTVNNPGAGKNVPSIMNIARVKATSDANEDFVDDGTAIINPDAGPLPLPVTLLSLNAYLMQDNKVKIDWSTSMEINCDKFNIERSYDGNLFSTVSVVAGNGTSFLKHSYSILDDISAATGAIVYYRLKQIDIDGKATYSKVLAVKLKKSNRQIAISPNPFSSYLNINAEWNRTEAAAARVINAEGKEVISKNIKMNKGLNYILIDEVSKLAAGNYFIEIISNTERFTVKVTKQ
jgi:uncharacterized repeat protein (TIGR01451 family)